MTNQDKHQKLLEQLHETYMAKNQDYGDSFTASVREYGPISAIVRMGDKWNRIKTLAKGGEQHVKDEAITDTLMDLANYAVMTVMAMEAEEEEEETEEEEKDDFNGFFNEPEEEDSEAYVQTLEQLIWTYRFFARALGEIPTARDCIEEMESVSNSIMDNDSVEARNRESILAEEIRQKSKEIYRPIVKAEIKRLWSDFCDSFYNLKECINDWNEEEREKAQDRKSKGAEE